MVGVDGSSPFAPTKYARLSFGETGILFFGVQCLNHDRFQFKTRYLMLVGSSAILSDLITSGAIV